MSGPLDMKKDLAWYMLTINLLKGSQKNLIMNFKNNYVFNAITI